MGDSKKSQSGRTEGSFSVEEEEEIFRGFFDLS